MDKQKYTLRGSVALAEETSKIVEVANRLGIILPSTHTALFKTVYAKIEEPNGNGIRLAKDAVLSSLQGLIGSQVNLEHLGLGFIVGIILDAWLNAEEEIEVVFTFAKNIYKEDYIRALEKMQEGKLAVSFELMSERSSQEILPDNTIRLHDIDWQGMGFLIDAEPAYKKARVYEMAKLYKQRATDSEKELVYASKIVKSCDDVIKAYMIDQDGLSLGVTSVTDSHFHVYKLNETGNGGKTIATHGGNVENHDHEIKDGFVMPGGKDNHTHSFMDQVMADMEEQVMVSPENPEMYCACPHCYMPMTYDTTIYDAEMNMYHKPCIDKGKISKPWYIKSGKKLEQTDKENTQGGVKIMTEEQKTLVAQLRAELEGYLPENISDDDLLVEAKVEEIRKAKTEAKAKEQADLEAKAKADAEAQKDAKIVELEATIEAQKKEIETFKSEAKAREEQAKAEKLASIKAEMKDNEFVKDFSDEDYFNEAKIKEAKILKENAVLKAENETLKKKTNKTKEQGSQEDTLPTGSGEDNQESVQTLIAKLGKK